MRRSSRRGRKGRRHQIFFPNKQGPEPTPPASDRENRPHRVFSRKIRLAPSGPARTNQTHQTCRTRFARNPPHRSPFAPREAKSPPAGGASTAALRSSANARSIRAMMLGVDSRGTNPDSRTMAGFVGKRKELEQVVGGLSDFSLSGPAAKSRRLVSQLAHFFGL
jgi:hypothetical protein